MDNTAFEIISSYEEFKIESPSEVEDVVIFRFGERRFAYLCPDKAEPSSTGMICVLDDATFDQPHILLYELYYAGSSTLPQGKYRVVCLYESGSVIHSLMSYEEKIVDAVERLIELLTLSPMQKEKEFQKEFLFYWDTAAQPGKREIYLDKCNTFSVLSVYQNSDCTRYIAPLANLNDLDIMRDGNRTWQERIDATAIYLPIIDNRSILPPTKDHPWTKTQIIEIICSDVTNHISAESFRQLGAMHIKYDTLDIVFEISVMQVPYRFLARVTFRGGHEKSVLERITNHIHSVEMLQSKNMDYCYLNQIIGNSTSNFGKRVLLIGAGSLGSYVASELVKNGFNDLTIYDGDDLSSENFMRWFYSGIFRDGKKASQLGVYLRLMHPEIYIDSHNENMDDTKLIEEMASADYIIFTIGTSDTQLRFNRILYENKCKAKVLFTWLEAGGRHSHVLKLDYSVPGCFECLFTDEDGNIVNNQANITADEIVELNTIRNGCGATRAAYGTSVLLRTTSVLLDILNREEHDPGLGSYLVNINPDSVTYDGGSFVKEVCHCCGN